MSSEPQTMSKSIKWSSVLDEELELERLAFDMHRVRQRLHHLRRQHTLPLPNLQLQRMLNIQAPASPGRRAAPAPAPIPAPHPPDADAPSRLGTGRQGPASTSRTTRETSTRAHSRQSGTGPEGRDGARPVRAPAGADGVQSPSPPALMRHRKVAIGGAAGSMAGQGVLSHRRSLGEGAAAPEFQNANGSANPMLRRRKSTRQSLSLNEPPSRELSPVETTGDGHMLRLPSRWVPKHLFRNDEARSHLI